MSRDEGFLFTIPEKTGFKAEESAGVNEKNEEREEAREMSDEIRRIKRELKFKGKIIDFYQDTMEINGDHTVIWDFIRHKGAAAVVPVREDGKILMVRQYRNALERYTLEIPAGALDEEDEPGIACASRELEEETGYGGGDWKELMLISGNPSTTSNLTHCFLAEGVKKVSAQHLDSTEDLSVCLLSLDQVRQLLVHDKIRQALMAAPLWKYFAEKGLL